MSSLPQGAVGKSETAGALSPASASPDPQPTAAPAAPQPARRLPFLDRFKQASGYVRREPRKSAAVLLSLVALSVAGWLLGRQAWAWHHLRAAQREVAKHHYYRAREHLEVCQRVWPNDPQTLIASARVARRMKAVDQADALLTRYRQVRGDDDALTLERALLRCETGDLDAVSDFCFALIEREHPESSAIFEALVNGQFHLFRLHEALMCIQLWQKLRPEDAVAYHYLGFAQELRVQAQEAIAAYQKAIELDPELFEARQRLAGQLVELAQAEAALPHLEYVLQVQPDNGAAKVDLARCLDQLGKQEEAEQMLDAVLEEHPQLLPALQERGVMALRLGQLPRAEELLKKAALLAPSSYQVHYQYSLCLQRLGKIAEARGVQDRLKQMEDDSKRLKEIIVVEMPRSPTDPRIHYDLGMIALRAGNLKEGVRWLESALTHDPNHGPTHAALAMYYERLGQLSRAERHRAVAGSSPTLKQIP